MSDTKQRKGGLGLILTLVGIVMAAFAAGIGFGIGFVIYEVRQTQETVHAFHGSLREGESILTKLEDHRFLERALPTRGSAIHVRSTPKKLACIWVFRSANGSLRVGKALAPADENLRLDEFPARVRELRTSLEECDEVDFTIQSGSTMHRGTVRVHYDRELKIRSVDAPYFWD